MRIAAVGPVVTKIITIQIICIFVLDNCLQTINMEALIAEIRQGADVIVLEQKMFKYLESLGSTHHHFEAGWSQLLGRWHPDMSHRKLQQHYWNVYAETNRLETVVNQKRTEMEQQCEHVWEKDWANRDERSRYMCKSCGKSR